MKKRRASVTRGVYNFLSASTLRDRSPFGRSRRAASLAYGRNVRIGTFCRVKWTGNDCRPSYFRLKIAFGIIT
jgi:hypothetical protein